MGTMSTVGGVIATFASFFVLLFIGTLIFGALPAYLPNTTGEWAVIEANLSSYLDLGTTILSFIAIIIMIAPLFWIIRSRRRRRQEIDPYEPYDRYR